MVRNANFITVLEANAPFEVSFDNGPRSDLETGLTLRTVSEFHRFDPHFPSNLTFSRLQRPLMCYISVC